MSKGGFSDRLKKKSLGANPADKSVDELEKNLDVAAPLENDSAIPDLKEELPTANESEVSADSEFVEENSSQSPVESEAKSDVKDSSDNNEKSFAQRYAKKNNFTSQKAEDLKPQKKNDPADISNVDPKKRAQADLIYLVKGIDDGRNAWYYVLVDRPKVQLFLKALNDDIIHLENYGVILYSAYGDDPPQEITDAVNKEYGIR